MAQENESSKGRNPAEGTATGKAREAGATSESVSGTGTGDDGFAWLVEHHKRLRGLATECEKVGDEEGVRELLPRVIEDWHRHATAHGLLYDAASDTALGKSPLLAQVAVQTDLVSFLLTATRQRLEGPLRQAGLQIAGRLIGEIIEREEKPRGGLLAKARAAGVDAAALGGRLDDRLASLSGTDDNDKPRMRHLIAIQEQTMPRYSNTPDRDERGRFVSDDDDDRYGRGSGRYNSDERDRDSRGRFMRGHDDDRERDGRGRFTGGRDDERDRDDRGRFMSGRDDGRDRLSARGDDDYRGGRGRDDDYSRNQRRYEEGSRGYGYSRPYDDDSRYGRDRGQGGWFGDSERHSEAGQRGWDQRRDDDDERYGSRGGYSRRYESGGRRGYSTRDNDDRDDRGDPRDRGQRGWFGDWQGHSEASREGWRHRRDDDDDRRPVSRGGRR